MRKIISTKKTFGDKRKRVKSNLLKQIVIGLKDVSKIQAGTIAPKSLSEILDSK